MGHELFSFEIQKYKTVCFSGYLPYEFPFPLEKGISSYERILARTDAALRHCIRNGYDTFLCGMEQGFEIMCGETIVFLRDLLRERIRLIAVLPYAQHAEKFEDSWQVRHANLLQFADGHFILSTDSKDVTFKKHRFLLYHSSALLCCFGNQSSETQKTALAAAKSGLALFNVFS